MIAIDKNKHQGVSRVAKMIAIKNIQILDEGFEGVESVQMFKSLNEFKKSRMMRRGSGIR